MSDYTPTTEQVRETYAALCKTEAAADEFDRWLAAHDREVRAGERARIIATLDADIDELETESEDDPMTTGVMRAVRLIKRADRLDREGGAS